MSLMKPWLLLTKEEREDRVYLYSILTIPGYFDELIAMSLKPPENSLEAQFELFVYQLRNKDKV